MALRSPAVQVHRHLGPVEPAGQVFQGPGVDQGEAAAGEVHKRPQHLRGRQQPFVLRERVRQGAQGGQAGEEVTEPQGPEGQKPGALPVHSAHRVTSASTVSQSSRNRATP